jgi:hypothetical protein
MPRCSSSESKLNNLRDATHPGIGSNLGIARAIAIELMEVGARVSSRPFDVNISTEDAGAKMARERQGGFVRGVYLAAIGLATIGWLWLIVWIVRHMI